MTMEETISREAAVAAATWWLNSMIKPVDESSRNFFIDVLASRITENEWLPELKCDGQPSGVLQDSAMESGIAIENYRDHTEMVLGEDGKILACPGEQMDWVQVWPAEAEE